MHSLVLQTCVLCGIPQSSSREVETAHPTASSSYLPSLSEPASTHWSILRPMVNRSPFSSWRCEELLGQQSSAGASSLCCSGQAHGQWDCTDGPGEGSGFKLLLQGERSRNTNYSNYLPQGICQQQGQEFQSFNVFPSIPAQSRSSDLSS